MTHPDYDRSRTDDFGGPQDLQNAWQILAGGAPDCARALVSIAKYGRVEAARVAAGKTVLEMMGFTGSNDRTQINVLPPAYDAAAPLNEGGVPASVKIRDRMKQLAAATIVEADPDYGQVVPAEEIVIAEIVED
jgi:hypothetical protein